MDGGGHERGMRSGTLNVPGIVGFGKAARSAGRGRDRGRALAACATGSRHGLHRASTIAQRARLENRLPGNLNVSFAYVEGEALMMASRTWPSRRARRAPARASSPRYVLHAMGVGDELAHSSIRFGLGRFTTDEEVDYVAISSRQGAEAARHVAALRDVQGGHRPQERCSGPRTDRIRDSETRRRATMAYSDKVIEHYENPRNVGTLDKNDERGHGPRRRARVRRRDAPADQGRRRRRHRGREVQDLRLRLGDRVSSLATEWLKGKTVDEAETIKNSMIVEELNLPPVKIHCSVLAEDAIKSAIADFRAKQAALPRGQRCSTGRRRSCTRASSSRTRTRRAAAAAGTPSPSREHPR
jgi:hypothetical protein